MSCEAIAKILGNLILLMHICGTLFLVARDLEANLLSFNNFLVIGQGTPTGVSFMGNSI